MKNIRILIAIWFLSGWSIAYCAGSNTRILIIMDANEEPYQQTIAGFKSVLSIKNTTLQFNNLTLEEAKRNPDLIDTFAPDLIFALGENALAWVSERTTQIPIVATLVLNNALLREHTNITGVSLDYALAEQIRGLKKLLPTQKNLAVLFNPKENANVIKDAKKICQHENLNLYPIPVNSIKELPNALGQLNKKFESLLAIPDKTVMTINTAKEILLASFREKLPLIGLSDNWVKSGALYALTWDYSDIGKQCALMVEKTLKGRPPKKILPERPRKTAYSINAKIAEHLNVHFSADILKNAKIVFD